MLEPFWQLPLTELLLVKYYLFLVAIPVIVNPYWLFGVLLCIEWCFEAMTGLSKKGFHNWLVMSDIGIRGGIIA